MQTKKKKKSVHKVTNNKRRMVRKKEKHHASPGHVKHFEKHLHTHIRASDMFRHSSSILSLSLTYTQSSPAFNDASLSFQIKSIFHHDKLRQWREKSIIKKEREKDRRQS